MCALIKTIWWPWCRTMGSAGKSPESTWQRRKWMTVRAKLLFIRLIELRERTRYWNFSFFFLGKRWPGESFYSENGRGPWFSKSGIFSTKRHRKRKEATGERTSLGWRGTCRSTCRSTFDGIGHHRRSVHLIDHLDVNSIKQSFNLNFNWIKGQFEWN